MGGKPLFTEEVFVSRPVVPSLKELTPLLDEVLKSRWLTNDGKFLIKFENKLKEFIKASYCSVHCNGTLALQLAVRALRVTGEVITTPFSFPATTHVLSWNNITPVFCDIDSETYNIDSEKFESLITSNTTAILPVHIFGNPCDVEKIEKFASNHGIKVIYDAAHAFGVELNGIPIGNYGDISMFSFHATKLFNTLEGGALVCKDGYLHQRLKDLRNFGIRSEEEIIAPGVNAKMNEVQAIFGILNLEKVFETIQKRKLIYERYRECLKDLPGIKFQKILPGTKYNYAYMLVEIDKDEFGLTRDQVYTCFRKENAMVRKYFYPLISNYPCYNALPSSDKKSLPNANRISNKILCLPLYSDLKNEEIDKIIHIFLMIYKKNTEIKKELL